MHLLYVMLLSVLNVAVRAVVQGANIHATKGHKLQTGEAETLVRALAYNEKLKVPWLGSKQALFS